MQFWFRRTLFLSCAIVLLASCNIMRYVPEDATLLNKVTIKTDVHEIEPSDLQPYLRQTPNNKFWGIGRAKLGFYSSQDINSNKWKDRWLRKIGEEPVIYDSVQTRISQEQLAKQMGNKGYLDATVDVEVSEKERKTNVVYHVTANRPYRISRYTIDIAHDSIMQLLSRRRSNSTPKRGDLFDVDKLAAERENVANFLQRCGYYYFQKEVLTFEADSSNHEVAITLKLSNRYLENDSALQQICTPQWVKTVTIYDFHDALDDEGKIDRSKLDTTFYDGYRIVHSQKSRFTSRFLAHKTIIKPNAYYNLRNVERTSELLNAQAAIKYVDISFRKREGDTLACFIVVAPAKRHAFSVELEGTNSAGDLGVGLRLSYQNKNIFRGAETLKISARGNYEATGKIGNLRHMYEVGGNVTLSVPMLLLPFSNKDRRKRVGGTTDFSLGYNFQQRHDFIRNIANLGMKYRWTYRRVHFTFDLLDINYIYLPWTSDMFKYRYLHGNSSIRFSYEDHFVMRLGFGLQYSNKRQNSATQSFYTLRTNISTAGNLLYGISNAIKQKKDDDGQYRIFNIAYSQYVKGNFDFTYNQYLDEGIRLVMHGGLGIAFPYGNAKILPYEERFFSGGANSVRGWAVRTLGPGRYQYSGFVDYLNQSGDIRLDLNLEARFKLFWKIHGALFIDAGNIWTIKEYDEQPGGVFRFDQFYKEIACSYGIGLRADFDFFVIRLDMGIKLYDPSYETPGQRWRTNLTWKNDVALHFAIGYPF